MSLYHHTQIGYVAILLLIICLSILMVLPLSNVPPLFLPIVIAAAVIMLGLFSTLTIEVTEEHLKFWFGIGLIHNRIVYTLADVFAKLGNSPHASWLAIQYFRFYCGKDQA